jgi:hypothetical protein
MKRSFFYHYNKPASLKAGHPILTLHFLGVCHLVNAIQCSVPTHTRNRKTQPRCVVSGKVSSVQIVGGTALVG